MISEKKIVLLGLLFLIIPSAFALDWDNRVKFIENGTYGTIEIKNSNLLIFEGDTLGSYTLTENTDLCGELCWAIGYASLESSDYLFRGTKAYDLTQSYEKEATFKYYIEEFVNKTFEQVIKGTEDCSTITLSDGEKHEVCSGGKTEKVIKEVPEWKEIDISKEKVTGKFKWKIEGRKGALDSVDWVAEAFGKELKAWATWESSLSVGLVEYWDFETLIQSSPYNITPASINGSASLLHNGTTILNTTGVYGSGISLNEASPALSMLNVNGSGSTQDGIFGETAMRNNFTMSFWIYQRNFSGVVSQGYFFTPASSEVHFLIEAPSYIEFNIRNASSNYLIYTNGAIGNWTAHRWNNLVYTYSTSSGYSIYVNGTKRATRSVQYPNAVATWKTAFGRRSDNTGNFMFNGTFDEIALWNRTLSDAEILSLYDGGTGTFYRTTSDASPTITQNNPVAYANYSYLPVAIDMNCTAEDNQQIMNMTIFLNGTTYLFKDFSASVTNKTSMNATFTPYHSAMFNWSCRAVDNMSVAVNSAVRYFTTNDTAPLITQNNPVSYFNSSSLNVAFNCTGEDNTRVNNMTLFINGTANQLFTFSGLNRTSFNVTKTLLDGVHNWSCNSVDNISQTTTSVTKYLTIDTLKPTLSISAPSSQTYGALQTGLNYSIYDLHNSTCWITNETTTSYINCAQSNWTIVTHAGSNNLTLYANDTFGNQNQTSVIFFIDVDVPAITITYPPAGKYNSTPSGMNYTYTEAYPSSCWWSINNGTNTTITCGQNVTGFSVNTGNNTLQVWLNDSFNRLANSSLTFEITQISPTITLNTPASGLMTNVSTHVFNCTATDDQQIKNVSLTLNSVVNYTQAFTGVNRTSISVSRTLADGQYNWTCLAYDNDSLSGTATARSLTIDSSAPVISVNSSIVSATIDLADMLSSCADYSASNTYRKTISVSVSDVSPTNCSITFFYNSTNLTFSSTTPKTIFSNPLFYSHASDSQRLNMIKAINDNSTLPYNISCSDGSSTSTLNGAVQYDFAYIVAEQEQATLFTDFYGDDLAYNPAGSSMEIIFSDASSTSIDVSSVANTQSYAGAYVAPNDIYCGFDDNTRYGFMYFNKTIDKIMFTINGLYFRQQVNPSYYGVAGQFGSSEIYDLLAVNYSTYALYELVVAVVPTSYSEPVLIKRTISGTEYVVASDFPSGSNNEAKFYLLGNYVYNIYGFDGSGNEVLLDTIILTGADSISVTIPSYSYDIVNIISKTATFHYNETTDNDTFTLYGLTNYDGAGNIVGTITNESGAVILTSTQTGNWYAQTNVNTSESGSIYFLDLSYPDGDTKQKQVTLGSGWAFGSVIFMSVIILIMAFSVAGAMVSDVAWLGFILSGGMLLASNKMFELHPVVVVFGWLLFFIGLAMAVMFRGRR